MRRTYASLLAALLLVPAAASFAQGVGPEFQINTYTTDYQGQQFAGGQHTVATDAAGNFVVVWSSAGSTGSDTSYFSIQARRFTAAGVPIGAEFQVNTGTLYFQTSPSVAEDTSGGFVVAWESSTPSGSDSYGSIEARRFDSSGIAIGMDFQVNTSTPGNQSNPSVAVDGSGGFVVAWESDSSSGSDSSADSIQARRFDSSGNAIGADFQVNTFTPSYQRHPSLATDASGSFVVAWQSDGSSGSDSSGYSIQARRFNSSGVALGADFQVNAFTPNNQLLPSIAEDGSGGFVVAWQSTGSSGSDQSGESVQARRFNSSGVAIGADFQVNTFTTFSQRYSSVAADATGAFVVAWTTYLSSGSDPSWSIQAKRFDSTGTAVGNEFQVNTFTPGFQRSASLAAGPDEKFVTAWMGEAAGPSSWNVFGRRMSFGSDATPPSVTVTAPNGGETLKYGVPFSITWTASDDTAVASIDVSYSTDGGTNFSPVPDCTGLAGSATSCEWSSPDPATVTAVVRVTATDAATNSTSDDSDAEFTIRPGILVDDVVSTEPGTAAFHVTLTSSSTQTVTVKYQTANGTATAGQDFTAKPLTMLTFTSGQTSKTVNVAVLGDTKDETNETFFLNLSAATNARIADSQGKATITDDDGPPTLSVADKAVTEGDTGSKPMNFTVSLSKASGKTVTVHYATAKAGTGTGFARAAAPADYQAKSGTLSIAPGALSGTVAVTILGDTLVEGNEIFWLNLDTPTNATIADNQGIGTIADNDSATATKRVFVSSSSFGANFGGAGAADTTCQTLASAATLGGSWRAWVSDSTSSPSVRFTRPTVPYERIDGTTIAANYAGLTSGGLVNAVTTDETGTVVPSTEVWTATNTNGTYGGASCNDFTDNSGGAPFALVGISDRSTYEWTSVYPQFCDRVGLRLYCVEQ